jgi:hypothetical protein
MFPITSLFTNGGDAGSYAPKASDLDRHPALNPWQEPRDSDGNAVCIGHAGAVREDKRGSLGSHRNRKPQAVVVP